MLQPPRTTAGQGRWRRLLHTTVCYVTTAVEGGQTKSACVVRQVMLFYAITDIEGVQTQAKCGVCYVMLIYVRTGIMEFKLKHGGVQTKAKCGV